MQSLARATCSSSRLHYIARDFCINRARVRMKLTSSRRVVGTAVTLSVNISSARARAHASRSPEMAVLINSRDNDDDDLARAR